MRHFNVAATKDKKKKLIIGAAVGAVALGVGGAMLWPTIARYASTGTAEGTATIAQWSIQARIGDNPSTEWTNISGATNTIPGTFALTATGINSHVETGKIAPGTVIQSEILQLRAQGSEVSVEYTFSLGSEARASAFTITGVEIANLGDLTFTPVDDVSLEDGAIRVIVPLANVSEAISFRVTAKWDGLCTGTDCDQDAMNTANTALGIAGGTTTFPVNVIARQHLGN